MWTMRSGQLPRDRAKLNAFEVQLWRRKVRFEARRLSRPQLIDHLKKERGRRRASDQGGVSFSVEIPDPDREHVTIKDGDRPGIAKSMGSSGLPKHRRRPGKIRIGHAGPWNLSEHIESEKSSFRTDEPRVPLRGRLIQKS